MRPPRIDAVERVSGKATYTRRRASARDALREGASQPASTCANPLRSTPRKALALPGVKAIVTHENCKLVWGAGSVAGGVQYNDQIKKTTKQRRYAFNNPVRFVGRPVAAVAAVNRHVGGRSAAADRGRLRSAAVRARSGRSAEAGRGRRSGRKAISRSTTGTRRSRC